MLVLILLPLTALMLYLLSRSMVRKEYETKDGKMISSRYRLSKQINRFFRMWSMFRAMVSPNERLLKFVTTDLSRWDERARAVTFGKSPYAYISSPDDLKIILNSSNVIERGKVMEMLRYAFGTGLVAAPLSVWRSHRRIIASTFTSSRSTEFYLKNCNEHADNLVRIFETKCATGEMFDLQTPVTKAAFRMILDSVVSDNITFADEDVDEMLEFVYHLCQLYGTVMPRPWLHPRMIFKLYVKIMGYQKYFDYKDKLANKYMSQKLKMYRRDKESDDAYEEGNITVMDDLLGRVDKGQFSLQQAQDEILTLLAGGTDPTVSAVCFTFLLLAGNPELQEKAYAEISNVIGDDDDKPIDIVMVEKMEYLEMCLKESLRMFSPVPFIMRRATADVKLSTIGSEFTIKNGTEVLIPSAVVHRNPKYYENPHVWNPENFNEEKEQSRHKFAFIPFGGGPRGCIGNKYAMMAGRVILAKVLRKYRLTTDIKPENVCTKMNLITWSKDGFPVQLHRRF